VAPGKVVNFNPDLGRGFVDVDDDELPLGQRRLLFTVAETQRGWAYPQSGEEVEVDVEVASDGRVVVRQVAPKRPTSDPHASRSSAPGLFPLRAEWRAEFRLDRHTGRALQEIERQAGARLVYPPNSPIALGDIVRIDGGVAVAVGNIAQRGVALTNEALPLSHITFSDGVNLTVARHSPGPGEWQTTAPQRMVVAISKRSGYLVSAAGVREERIRWVRPAGRPHLVDELASWDRNTQVVSSVRHADRRLVILSRGPGTEVELDFVASAEGPTMTDVGSVERVVSSRNAMVFLGTDGVIFYDVSPLATVRELLAPGSLTTD
jgi:hypothetical protein